jgi:hypothetical protein
MLHKSLPVKMIFEAEMAFAPKRETQKNHFWGKAPVAATQSPSWQLPFAVQCG